MTAVAAPRTGRPQWQTALEEANRVRLARACWKRRLGDAEDVVAGRELAAEILEEGTPEVLLGMEVGEFLGACRRLGDRAVRRLTDAANVRASMSLGELTSRQRAMLIGALRAHSTYHVRARRGAMTPEFS